jgi:hypothetical protein
MLSKNIATALVLFPVLAECFQMCKQIMSVNLIEGNTGDSLTSVKFSRWQCCLIVATTSSQLFLAPLTSDHAESNMTVCCGKVVIRSVCVFSWISASLPLNTMISVTCTYYDDDSRVAVEGYHRHFRNHWILNFWVFNNTCQRLQDTGTVVPQNREHVAWLADAVEVCMLDLV